MYLSSHLAAFREAREARGLWNYGIQTPTGQQFRLRNWVRWRKEACVMPLLRWISILPRPGLPLM